MATAATSCAVRLVRGRRFPPGPPTSRGASRPSVLRLGACRHGGLPGTGPFWAQISVVRRYNPRPRDTASTKRHQLRISRPGIIPEKSDHRQRTPRSDPELFAVAHFLTPGRLPPVDLRLDPRPQLRRRQAPLDPAGDRAEIRGEDGAGLALLRRCAATLAISSSPRTRRTKPPINSVNSSSMDRLLVSTGDPIGAEE